MLTLSKSDQLSQNSCPGCQGSARPRAFSQKRNLWRLAIGLGFFLLAFLFRQESFLPIFLYAAAYLVFGYDVLFRAATKLIGRQVFDEHFLMSLATIGALVIGEYPEAVAVMLFYQVGEFFQERAVARSRRSIEKLQQIRPDIARRLEGENLVTVDPTDVAAEDRLVVLPGDRVPVDGIILKGQTDMDTAAMTGESVPRTFGEGETILAGFVNLSGRITLRALRPAENSAVSRILDMVEQSSMRKAKTERFISRFARIYTPVVVGLALLTAFAIPLILNEPFADWIYRALILLVISCPCALVLSVPLSYFAGLGAASRRGLLVKGGQVLERLASLKVLVFDKTGTLTDGDFEVVAVKVQGKSEEEVLRLAAIAEMHSTHPIARSILKAWQQQGGSLPPRDQVRSHQDLAGLGVRASLANEEIMLGNRRHLEAANIQGLPRESGKGQTELFVALDRKYIGSILLADQAKPAAKEAIRQLKKMGISRVILLSGDHQQVVDAMAANLDLGEAHGEKMPEQKLALLEMILASDAGTVAYLGDGINDAPVLTRADLGIAMGNGSDAAIESADAILMGGELENLPPLIQIARKTNRIVRQNVILALSLKVLIMSLALFGLSGIWQAIFADVGVSLLAVLNAMRLTRRHKKRSQHR